MPLAELQLVCVLHHSGAFPMISMDHVDTAVNTLALQSVSTVTTCDSQNSAYTPQDTFQTIHRHIHTYTSRHWLCVGSVSQVQQDEEWDDWVRQAFKSLDTNQDGVICEDDMRLTMNEELEEVLTILHLLQSF